MHVPYIFLAEHKAVVNCGTLAVTVGVGHCTAAVRIYMLSNAVCAIYAHTDNPNFYECAQDPSDLMIGGLNIRILGQNPNLWQPCIVRRVTAGRVFPPLFAVT